MSSADYFTTQHRNAAWNARNAERNGDTDKASYWQGMADAYFHAAQTTHQGGMFS